MLAPAGCLTASAASAKQEPINKEANMKSLKIGLYLLAIALPTAANANEFAEATNALCQKTKACALETMGSQEGISPDMKAMIMQSLDGVCASIEQQFNQDMLSQHELVGPATACMQSMSKLSCAEMEEMSEDSTKECKDYYEQAQSYR